MAERIKPRPVLAFEHVDQWCAKCGHLTKPEEDRVQVIEGKRVRYDHADECPSETARAYTRGARSTIQGND